MKKATCLLLSVFIFTIYLKAQTCQTFVSTDVPKAIPDLINVSVSSIVSVSGLTGNITDVNVEDLNGIHAFVYDLKISLEHPDGTTRILFEQICDDEENFDVKFDDEAALTYDDFNPDPLTCNSTTGLYYQPKESLSNFNGKTATGVWKLNILDVFLGDEGILQSWSIEICTDGILPVSLSDFSAEYLKEKHHVELNWHIAEEHNVSHFEIWRSNNEDSDFELIGFNEFKHENKDYTFIDNNIKQGQIYYYKLKTVDYDDSFHWSKIVSATTGATDLFTKVSPNPFSNSLNINIALENDEQVQFNLYDVGGRLITSTEGNFSGVFEWDLSYLEGGIYIFEMLTPFNKQVQRVIKM